MNADVARLHDYYLKLETELDFSEFVQECFELASKCVQSGNPNKLYRIWNFETNLPKGVRKALKSDNIMESLRYFLKIYLEIAQEYEKGSDTEEMTEEEVLAVECRLKSFYSTPLKELPNFLSSCKIYLDPKFNQQTRNELVQIIVMNGGLVESIPIAATQILVAPNGKIIDPHVINLYSDWIYTCHKQQTKVNEDPFKLV